jgi:hypothetical protein
VRILYNITGGLLHWAGGVVDALRQFYHQHFGRIGRATGVKAGDAPKPNTLSAYQSAPLPPAPAKSMPFRLRYWGMYGNDQYGDCVFAACAHAWMALARLLKQKWTVSLSEVTDSYKSYMNQYNGGADNGAVPNIVLQNWHTQGMWGTTIPAWAPINHADMNEVHQSLFSFGALMVCIQLPKPAYTYQMGSNYVRFRMPTWKLTGTADDNVIIGGHEIAAIGYDKQYVYCVTWGVVVRLTHAWWNKYVTEACALIVPAITTAGAFGGLDLASLTADLAALPS